jgi:hypothetical protein
MVVYQRSSGDKDLNEYRGEDRKGKPKPGHPCMHTRHVGERAREMQDRNGPEDPCGCSLRMEGRKAMEGRHQQQPTPAPFWRHGSSISPRAKAPALSNFPQRSPLSPPSRPPRNQPRRPSSPSRLTSPASSCSDQLLILPEYIFAVEKVQWSMRMEGGGGGGGCLGMGHGGEAQIKGTHTHGGRYVQYNIYGNLFEVSAKYVPPIRPVGRGACGIIWCVPSSSLVRFIINLWITTCMHMES